MPEPRCASGAENTDVSQERPQPNLRGSGDPKCQTEDLLKVDTDEEGVAGDHGSQFAGGVITV